MNTSSDHMPGMTLHTQLSLHEARELRDFCQNPHPADSAFIQEFKAQTFTELKKRLDQIQYARATGVAPSPEG